jgi:hypothetical protein
MACSFCGEKGHNIRTCPQATDKDRKRAKKKEKRARGGQPGNTNAVKHGFYSDRFLPGEKSALDLIEEHIDVHHEITLLRVISLRVIDQLLTREKLQEYDPEDAAGLLNSASSIAARIGHLVRLQHRLFGQGGDWKDALDQALREVAEELDLG